MARDLDFILSEEKGMRIVTWGDLTPYACGETHMKKTTEIGEICIIKVKEKKG
jgi:Ser-tRNA(Ala) deacylase AlaX